MTTLLSEAEVQQKVSEGLAALPLQGKRVLVIIPDPTRTMSQMIWASLDWKGWLVLFLLAAGPTLLGFGTYNLSLSYLPSSVANLIVTLEPVFTTIMAYFLFGETLTALQLGGAALIVGGVVLIRVTEGMHDRRVRA